MLPRRKNQRLSNFNYNQSNIYHVIICTHNKGSIFIKSDLNFALIECLIRTKTELLFDLYVFCLMPDHIHLLVSPKGEADLPTFIRYFKGRATRLCRDRVYPCPQSQDRKIWQRSYYDHILRQEESVRKIAEYILNNPVRKGLAEFGKHPYTGFVDDLPL